MKYLCAVLLLLTACGKDPDQALFHCAPPPAFNYDENSPERWIVYDMFIMPGYCKGK